jgi:hypothetical protein
MVTNLALKTQYPEKQLLFKNRNYNTRYSSRTIALLTTSLGLSLSFGSFCGFAVSINREPQDSYSRAMSITRGNDIELIHIDSII